MTRSTLPSMSAPLDPNARTTPPPNKRDALGFVLAPEMVPSVLRDLDLASLLLSCLSDHERSPIQGILDGVAADLHALDYAARSMANELGSAHDLSPVIDSVRRRVLVASELTRRTLEAYEDRAAMAMVTGDEPTCACGGHR